MLFWMKVHSNTGIKNLMPKWANFRMAKRQFNKNSKRSHLQKKISRPKVLACKTGDSQSLAASRTEFEWHFKWTKKALEISAPCTYKLKREYKIENHPLIIRFVFDQYSIILGIYNRYLKLQFQRYNFNFREENSRIC